MTINDISADGYVNTDRLENTLTHLVNELKDSNSSPLSFIDTNLFVTRYMDNYEKFFKDSIDKCYKETYDSIFSSIKEGLNAKN